MDPRDYLDPDEGRDEPVLPERCANCAATAGDGISIEDYLAEDGQRLRLCSECSDEEKRMEDQASKLAGAEIACAERMRIVDEAASSGQLVNRMRAHEAACPVCRADALVGAQRVYRANEADAGAVALRVDPSVRLTDNRDWTNRFEIHSESSDRVYTIAQNKRRKFWACSCPRWRSNPKRDCKHLRAIGLPGGEQPYEARLES